MLPMPRCLNRELCHLSCEVLCAKASINIAAAAVDRRLRDEHISTQAYNVAHHKLALRVEQRNQDPDHYDTKLRTNCVCGPKLKKVPKLTKLILEQMGNAAQD